jgi:hypothetical protein
MVLAAQLAAVIVSAIGIIATIIWNRTMIRRRATLDMLLAEQTNEVLLKMQSDLRQAHATNDLISYAEQEKWYTPDAFFLPSTLNRYDLMAIGIAEGIVDRRLLKKYWRASFVMTWIGCKDCVRRRREIRGDLTLYSDFENLALKWATPMERKLF